MFGWIRVSNLTKTLTPTLAAPRAALPPEGAIFLEAARRKIPHPSPHPQDAALGSALDAIGLAFTVW